MGQKSQNLEQITKIVAKTGFEIIIKEKTLQNKLKLKTEKYPRTASFKSIFLAVTENECIPKISAPLEWHKPICEFKKTPDRLSACHKNSKNFRNFQCWADF